MNVATETRVAPASAFQLYLVDVCGHSLTRGPSNIWQLEANPERMEFTAGGTGHIPYADENAADDFAAAFEQANPVFIGPVAERHSESMFRRDGLHVRENGGGFAVPWKQLYK
jgi:hypothetical protein